VCGWQPEADNQEGVDQNTEIYKRQLLGYVNGMINSNGGYGRGGGGGGGGRW
jgi:hypothetical protein